MCYTFHKKNIEKLKFNVLPVSGKSRDRPKKVKRRDPQSSFTLSRNAFRRGVVVRQMLLRSASDCIRSRKPRRQRESTRFDAVPAVIPNSRATSFSEQPG